MSAYDLSSTFDIEKHKATFKDYLEVIIEADGTILYATPSHQEKAVELAGKKLRMTRQEISDMCPGEFYGDYLRWLLSLTGAAAVWNNMVLAPTPTKAQISSLRKLKMAGLYHGTIPKILPQDL